MNDEISDKPKVAPGTTRMRIEESKRKIKRAIVAVLVGGFLLAIVLPIAALMYMGRGPEARAGEFGNTLQKIRHAESMRRYTLAPDSTITPARAGEAFVSLGAREGYAPRKPGRAATRGPFSLPMWDPALFPDARSGEWRGPSWTKILPATRRGLTKAENDYLASLAANPIWAEYRIVARAARMDLAAAMYETPFADSLSPGDLPMVRYAATRELAVANVSRAAWHLANKRPHMADSVLRETISNGIRLIDDGNMLSDHLVGASVVDIGRRSLEQLYEITANPELASLRADTLVTRRTTRQTSTTRTLAQVIADSTLPRGMRLELILSSNLEVCRSARGLFSGTSKDVDDASVRARQQIVRTEAEGAVFDLAVHVLDRPRTIRPPIPNTRGFPKAIMTMSRLPALLLGKPRLVNCAAMLSWVQGS